ncbi:hypothetical protein [Lacticaseibacillus daqingensis]|uniref:hypothetical protein n=1 Tax=Lacticaseibacillus daqingensis TaxID=2486014 RepID=UPI000F78BE8D|nr:hypothetical protein [Lacticaseibacillus daqingensis]
MGTWIRFEWRKQHARWWLWPLVLVIVGVGVFGASQQKAAQQRFLVRYRQSVTEMVKRNEWFVPEQQALASSARTYNRWYVTTLGITSGKRAQTPDNLGISLRNAADLTGATGWYGFQSQMLRAYERGRLIEARGLTGPYPFSMTFTDQELAAMPKIDQQTVRRWSPQFAVQGFDYLVWLIRQNAPAYLLLLATLLFGGNFASELGRGRAHSDWLRLQGQSTVAQVLLQGGLLFCRLVGFTLLPLALITGVVGLREGFGALRLPLDGYVYNAPFDQFASGFIDVGQVIGRATVLTVALAAVITAATLLLASLIANGWLTAVGSALLVALFLITPPITWLPLTYFKQAGIALGETAFLTDNVALQTQTGVLTCLAWTVGLALLIAGVQWRQRRMVA